MTDKAISPLRQRMIEHMTIRKLSPKTQIAYRLGPRHARFSNFVRSPRLVIVYVRDVALLRAPRYLGHNPAGGAMIVLLLIMLAGTSISGYMMTTDAF